MKKTLFIIMVLTTFGCEQKPKSIKVETYHEKANSLIKHILLNEKHKCNCLLEISDESLLSIRRRYMPLHEQMTRDLILKELHLKNNELDSLEAQTLNFSFDTLFLEKLNFQLIKSDSIIPSKYPKNCNYGVMSITKPTFDKEMKTAVIEIDEAIFNCFPGTILTYKYSNNKWALIE